MGMDIYISRNNLNKFDELFKKVGCMSYNDAIEYLFNRCNELETCVEHSIMELEEYKEQVETFW